MAFLFFCCAVGSLPVARRISTAVLPKRRCHGTRELYVLLDTGCSSSILSDNYFNYVKNIKKSKSHYSAAGGPYKTSRMATMIFKLPEFSMSKDITW